MYFSKISPEGAQRSVGEPHLAHPWLRHCLSLLLFLLFVIRPSDRTIIVFMIHLLQGGNGGFRSPGIFRIFMVLPGFLSYSQDCRRTPGIFRDSESEKSAVSPLSSPPRELINHT